MLRTNARANVYNSSVWWKNKPGIVGVIMSTIYSCTTRTRAINFMNLSSLLKYNEEHI